MKYLSNIDLSKNELQNARIQNLATAPSNPVNGQIYFNSGNNNFYGWNGTSWLNMGGTLDSASIVGIINSGSSTIDDDNLSTNVNDAITKKHYQNTDTTLTGSGVNIINTTGAGNIVDFKLNSVAKTSIDNNGNFTGKSATADKLATAKTISISGDISGTATAFDGSANITIPTTLPNVATAGTATKVTFNAKGLVTSGTTLALGDLPSINLSNLADSNITTLTSGQLLQYNGTKWVNYTPTYISGNQTITVSGDASGSGTTAISLTLPNIVTAGTNSKITYNAKGQVTGGAALTSTDIPTLTSAKISDFDSQVRTNRLDQLAAPTTDISINSHKITNVTDPTSAQDVATKNYVDAARSGLSIKDPVRVASTTNVAIATGGLLTVDGITLIAGDRVLLKNQTVAAENGIYVVAAGAWTRATDADNSPAGEVTAGMATWVNEGTINLDSRWVLTTNNPITLGTTSLTFTKDFQASDLIAGAGLTKTGNTIDVVGTANRITVNADSVDIASTYAGQNTITTLGTITTGTWQSTDIGIAYGGTGASDALTARANLGATGKYTTNVGDGTSTTITVTHGLNTMDIVISLRETISPYNGVMTDWQIVDANSIKLLFSAAPTSGQYRITVIG